MIDVEAPAPHDGLDGALELARRHGVAVALSNPCFELWIMLHFKDVTRYNTSDGAQRELERLGACGYSTVRKHLSYETLRDGFGQARDRAETLRQRAPKGHRQNPWTDVDRLVGLLKAARYR